MKNSIFNMIVLSIILSSCSKTTKSKMINDWKVESYRETYTITNEYDEETKGTVVIDQNTFKSIEDVSQGTDHEVNGKVNEFNYYIKSDGTWSMTSDVTTDATPTSISQRIVKEVSGTWTLLKKSKVDDFKKNERIQFNTLAESRTVTNENMPDNPQTFVANFLTGEKVGIYTVLKSKRDLVELERKVNNSVKVGQNENNEVRVITFTLAN